MLIIWERRHTADPMDHRRYKGGDGGAGQARADEEARQAKVQAATDAINAKFGYGKEMSAPDRNSFNRTRTVSTRRDVSPWESRMPVSNSENADIHAIPREETEQYFDQAGYDAAVEKVNQHNKQVGEAGVLRQKQYDEVGAATKQLNMRELSRAFDQATKQNVFGLARSGLLGSSMAADADGDLQERYGEGVIRSEKAGMDAAAQLKSQDERARSNLISLAQSGIDTGTAASMAAAQMSANAEAARASNNTQNLDQLFSGLSQAYLARQQAQVQQRPSSSYGGGSNRLYGSSGYFGSIQ